MGWSIAKLNEKYFDDQDKILEDSGWCSKPKDPPKKSGEIECRVCMDDVNVKEVYSLPCGHQDTCKSCWYDYLSNSVKSKQCISLPCPSYKCKVIIPLKAWKYFFLNYKLDETLYNRYLR